jgi:hypothetical protein
MIVNVFFLLCRLPLKYFLILLIIINLYFIFQNHYFQNAQVGGIHDTFNVCNWAIKDSLNSDDPQDIISHLVYVYGYYPPGTRYISSSSPLNDAIEQGRSQTITILLLILQAKTNAGLGSNLDQWVKTFGDEQTQYSYDSHKIYREEHNLSDMRTDLILLDVLNCCHGSKEKLE